MGIYLSFTYAAGVLSSMTSRTFVLGRDTLVMALCERSQRVGGACAAVRSVVGLVSWHLWILFQAVGGVVAVLSL